jgi:hypothetical protein
LKGLQAKFITALTQNNNYIIFGYQGNSIFWRTGRSTKAQDVGGQSCCEYSTVDASVMQNSYKIHCNLAINPGFWKLKGNECNLYTVV